MAATTAMSGCLFGVCMIGPSNELSCPEGYIPGMGFSCCADSNSNNVCDEAESSADTLGVVCNPPYIQYGQGCCLDRNDDGRCDNDETTTTLMQTTTTLIASTTTTSTTTTTLRIACNMSKDCGNETSYLKCQERDVVRYIETPFCSNPGTPNALCIKKSKTNFEKTCAEDEECRNGTCVKQPGTRCMEWCSKNGYENGECSFDACKTGEKNADAAYNDCGQGFYMGGGSVDLICCCNNITHTECSENHCSIVPGEGYDECSSDYQCQEEAGPHPTLP
ncbi:MAG: hypothetical protein NTU61_04660 [Candidatus Altiarchaeota archaeon]|nr:hypothetical protein [Candidatus Altiarchaeota archaeon]